MAELGRDGEGGHPREGARPRVVAVVLTWNDTQMSARCIESLLANDYPNLEITLVDNGSVEPCGERLGARFPSVDVVRLPQNRGFTGGSNAGLRRALDRGAEYVFFLNNDTVVAPNAVTDLVAALEASPRAGAASALILLVEGSKRQVQFFTGTIDRNTARHVHPEDGMAVDAREWPIAETEFAPACAILFRSKALEDVGLFDESFGTNWEDYDLCIRLADGGWKILTVGSAHVDHLHGATTGRASPYITYLFTRNRLICLVRYGKPMQILRNAPFIARTFYRQVRRYGFGNWACHAAFAKAWLHFLFAVRGEKGTPRSRKG
jgi:GT2 family glycosyltransferase